VSQHFSSKQSSRLSTLINIASCHGSS